MVTVKVLYLITGSDTGTSREVVESFSRLFTTYCYPADQLASLTVRLDSSRDSENLSSYLDMLEQVMNNLAESEARWAANLMEVKEAERDSALESSELEENNNNNNNNPGSRLEEFSPYLAILRTGGESCVELTLSHLHRLVARADGDSRHKIALQVILPYLASSLDTGGEEKEGQADRDSDKTTGHSSSLTISFGQDRNVIRTSLANILSQLDQDGEDNNQLCLVDLINQLIRSEDLLKSS